MLPLIGCSLSLADVMSAMGFATIYFMDVVVFFFRLFQQEKDYILSMATSMVPWIADINERKDIVTFSWKLEADINFFYQEIRTLLQIIITITIYLHFFFHGGDTVHD
jgi:hypothetical protein